MSHLPPLLPSWQCSDHPHLTGWYEVYATLPQVKGPLGKQLRRVAIPLSSLLGRISSGKMDTRGKQQVRKNHFMSRISVISVFYIPAVLFYYAI